MWLMRPRDLKRSSAGAVRGSLVRMRNITTHESNVLLALSFVVGVLAGGGAILLEGSLRFFGRIFLGAPEPTTTDLARVAIAPRELPVGAVTALIGAPVFIYLLNRSGKL